MGKAVCGLVQKLMGLLIKLVMWKTKQNGYEKKEDMGKKIT